jgi:hypothetical protein
VSIRSQLPALGAKLNCAVAENVNSNAIRNDKILFIKVYKINCNVKITNYKNISRPFDINMLNFRRTFLV